MPVAALTSKGQLTMPKSIRIYLHLDTGDRVEFIIGDDGKVVVKPKTLDVKDIFGIIKSHKGISVEDMNEAIKKSATRRFKHERH